MAILTKRQKAALFILNLGPSMAAKVFQHLNEEEMMLMTESIANIPEVEKEQGLTAVKDVTTAIYEFNKVDTEGFLRETLDSALGAQKAEKLLGKMTGTTGAISLNNAFDGISIPEMSRFLKEENAQIKAIVMAHLNPDDAILLFNTFPEEDQPLIMTKVADLKKIDPKIVLDLAEAMREACFQKGDEQWSKAGGVQTVVKLFKKIDKETKRRVFDELEVSQPIIADKVRRLMFVFSDCLNLDDRAMRRVLQEIDTSDLTLALKGESKEIRDKFLNNLSKRASEMVNEELEFMGPVKRRQIIEAQDRIIETIRNLEEQGEIILYEPSADEGGEEELIY